MASDQNIFEPRTAAEGVAARLRSQIQRGELEPGEPLRQNEVAKRLGVSTTPVREAFALLQADGLVRIDRYRGAVVFRPTPADVRHAYEVREALELLAAAKAAPHLTEEEYEELDSLLAKMRRTTDPERWIEMNDAFHLGIYTAGQNPRLLALIASQRDACAQYIRINIATPAHRKAKDAQHQEILSACRAHDIERAQAAISVHLRDSMREILALVHESPANNGDSTSPAAEIAAPRPT